MSLTDWFSVCPLEGCGKPLGPYRPGGVGLCPGHIEPTDVVIDYPGQDRCSLTARQVRARERAKLRGRKP